MYHWSIVINEWVPLWNLRCEVIWYVDMTWNSLPAAGWYRITISCQVPNYCSIGATLSPRILSIFLIHWWVACSTISSSSSCNSLMKGSISGRCASHSSPSRSVKLCSQKTAANRVAALSDRIYRRITLFSCLWWLVESATTTSSVRAGMTSVNMGISAAWSNWQRRASAIGEKWEGDCQKSAPSSVTAVEPGFSSRIRSPSWSCSNALCNVVTTSFRRCMDFLSVGSMFWRILAELSIISAA